VIAPVAVEGGRTLPRLSALFALYINASITLLVTFFVPCKYRKSGGKGSGYPLTLRGCSMNLKQLQVVEVIRFPLLKLHLPRGGT
jgi:hypothetical protein